MKLGALPKLSLRTRRAQARDSFIGSSLTSSAELSDRLIKWSGSNDRGCLHVMKFHDDWQHANCSVMKWYYLQSSSSTRFRVVEHRQNVQGPFFHEFLLLRLTDDSVCRVERTGNGSRADALRRVGCAANDLIQWFTADDYSVFAEKVPSKLLAAVDLGKEFDILDVLAICYSIQRNKMSRVYTQQRYNCYFLCLTVLSVLTRRLAGWENAIQNETWDQSLNASLDAVLDLTPEQSKVHLTLRLCAVLDPSSSEPAKFIIDELRSHLTAQRGGLTHVNDSLVLALWHTGWNSAIGTGLKKSMEGVDKTIVYRHKNACATALRSAFDDSADMMRQKLPCYDTLKKAHTKEFLRYISSEMGRFAKLITEEREMLEIECPSRFGARGFYSLLGFIGGALLSMNPGMFRGGDDDPDSLLNGFAPKRTDIGTRMAMIKIGRTVSQLLYLSGMTDGEHDREIAIRCINMLNGETTIPAFAAVMDKLETEGTFGSLEATVLVHFMRKEPHWDTWLFSLVTATFGRLLEGILQTYDLPTISVFYATNLKDAHVVSVKNFQDDCIIKRIQTHATRVATHQLAAAPLVVDNMQATMSDVWKTMPLGFGVKPGGRTV